MSKLRVNDLFESIQGEGLDIGRRVVFVRFSGCNLNCSWCDTDFTKVKHEVDSVELVKMIEDEFPGTDYVVLTGGEPLIQDSEELESLCISLRGKGYRVAVETNGTIAPDRFSVPNLLFDLMSISPKLGSAEVKVGLDYTHVAEWSNFTKVCCKFVIQSQEDMQEALKYLDEYEFSTDMALAFQPEASTGSDGYHAMIDWFDEETGGAPLGREVRFLIQMHKVVGVE